MIDLQQYDHLLVYGARLAGREIRADLVTRGLSPSGFLDKDTTLGSVDGLPVATARQWAQENNPSCACVVIGLFNNHVDMGEVVGQLQEAGYGRIVSLIEYVRAYPDGQPFRFWLVDPRFYESHAAPIAAMRERLADETSRELLDRIVEFRTTGNYLTLPEPSAQQYYPEDLPQWPQPLRLIDCGAYIGDTISEFRSAGFEFEAVAAFEPNLKNFEQLVHQLASIDSYGFPCGVSDANKQIGFDGSLGPGGHVDTLADEQIICVRLDDVLPGFAPTLIKMDIEGEEPAALKGAEKIIFQYRPNLAISVYHKPEHLWSILEQLESYGLGYRYYLRCHARITFDTVLYAINPDLIANQ